MIHHITILQQEEALNFDVFYFPSVGYASITHRRKETKASAWHGRRTPQGPIACIRRFSAALFLQMVPLGKLNRKVKISEYKMKICNPSVPKDKGV